MAVNGKALGIAVAGGILLYTGLTEPTGNPKHLLQTLLSGKLPAKPGTQGIGTSSGSSSTGSGTSPSSGNTPQTSGSGQTPTSNLPQLPVIGGGSSPLPVLVAPPSNSSSRHPGNQP